MDWLTSRHLYKLFFKCKRVFGSKCYSVKFNDFFFLFLNLYRLSKGGGVVRPPQADIRSARVQY